MKQGKQSSGFWKDRMKTTLLDGSTTKLRAGILVSDPCFVTVLCVLLDGVTHCCFSFELSVKMC